MEDGARITIRTPVEFDDELPERADVVVIGGGVIGIFTALYLARKNLSVVVCEKGRVAGEQSSRNWGWIRQQGRDLDELPIMMQALKLWHEADRETNGQCGVVTAGTWYLARSEAELDGHERWARDAAALGLDARMVSASEVTQAFSGAADGRWIGGLSTPSDARGEPWTAVRAVARLARIEGARVREDCAVRGLDLAAGRVAGVVTEAGAVACEQVVLAGGAWSSLFARRHGHAIPQLSVEGTVAQTAPLPDFFSGCARDSRLGIRRRADGGYTLAPVDRVGLMPGPDAWRHLRAYLPVLRKSWRNLDLRAPWPPAGQPDAWGTPREWADDDVSPFERTRVLEPVPRRKVVDLLRDRFAERFPRIGRPRVLDCWAGMIDAMPDVVPIVDRVPDRPGLIVATGMCGHGFGIGPGFGRAVARMAAGEEVEHDMRRFRFARFSDGSPLDLRAGL